MPRYDWIICTIGTMTCTKKIQCVTVFTVLVFVFHCVRVQHQHQQHQHDLGRNSCILCRLFFFCIRKAKMPPYLPTI